MNTYLTTSLILTSAFRNFAQAIGEPPGVLSTQKCYEYREIEQDVPSYYYQAQEENSTKAFEDEDDNDFDFNIGDVPYVPKPENLHYMVSLGYEVDNETQYHCGGALISEKFVLTAAHCILSKDWGVAKYIRLGDINATNTTDSEVQVYEIEEHYIHPSYLPPIKYHDIALMKLNGTVNFTDETSPVCLEPKRQSLKDRTFYYTAWDLSETVDNSTDFAVTGELKHFSLEKCKEAYNESGEIPNGIVDGVQICAGAKNHKADICQGGSGGPLTYLTVYPETALYLVGIMSFGKGCPLSEAPTVFTRISKYLDWIEKVVWPEGLETKPKIVDGDRIIFPDELKHLYYF